MWLLKCSSWTRTGLVVLHFFVTKVLKTVSLQIKVMHKQLLLFHNAIAAYFSGNSTLLEATIKQFSVSFL